MLVDEFRSQKIRGLQSLLESKVKRQEFLSVFERNGLSLAALNCSGNQLHPVDGDRQSKVVYDTVRLAELVGIHTIVLMSGLPAGGPNDLTPNWVTCAWPTENSEILLWQWNEKLLPYWEKLTAFGKEHGIQKFGIEMHVPGYAQRIVQFCRKYGGFRPRLATIDKANGLVESLALAANEEAISIQPAFISHLKVPNVAMVPIADAGATWDLFIVWQRGKIASPLRTLLNELNLKSQ